MATIAPNSFDRSKPFYPLVMTVLAQLLGFKELAVRGIVGCRSIDEVMSQFGGPAVVSDQALTSLRQSLEAVMSPLELRSEFSANHIRVDVSEMAREIALNGTYLAGSLLYALGTVFVLAHEMSKDKPWHDQGPLWEFLRHCRHAAAHGGRFNLLNGEPRRLAKWGPFEITRSLQGTPLFKRQDGSGMLSPGDPIRLLWDIEHAYPQMSV
ncbi:hypothetical protein MELA_03002 [Candidatus Methylomirabilis lanthanidiphila]|uniref:Uncharacterized protein n=1 Tax=Candidatus Methylomirabilis lanthanidiphila TaxID=2211376 RepID=A0A564ZP23_9BACT|nr:hypothetical protein [Candidatus Methylomirabilis lanthanidiphila]VUZ86597.1 hypothetical protein MELA_03002 [Candidatus Methylomirabilis lanthanidiphila]